MKKKDLLKKQDISQQPSQHQTWHLSIQKTFAWLKPHKIFESPPYWQGHITQA